MNCNPCCGCFPPITTYNPSAVDNFPTILQQVEYLKALLKKYPSQQWFITQEKVTEETIKLDSTKVVLRGRAIAEGDFILGNKEDGTTLMFQYTGATIEVTNYVVEFVGIYSNQIVAEQALTLAQAVDTKAQQALDLATTNETDIGTLDGQVAQIETNLSNKQDKITKTTSLSCRKIQTDSLSYTMELGSDSTEYDYGLTFASKTMVSTGQLKPSFVDEKFFEWVLPAKSGTLATTEDIRMVSSIEVTLTPATATRGTLTDEQLATLLLNDNCYIKHNGLIYTLFKHNDENTVLQYTAGYLNDTKNVQNIKVLVNSKAWVIENIVLPQAKTYKHTITITGTSTSGWYCNEPVFIQFYSSKNLKCDSLTDLKTILGNTFYIDVKGAGITKTDESDTCMPRYMTEVDLKAFNGVGTPVSISLSGFVFIDDVKTI